MDDLGVPDTPISGNLQMDDMEFKGNAGMPFHKR